MSPARGGREESSVEKVITGPRGDLSRSDISVQFPGLFLPCFTRTWSVSDGEGPPKPALPPVAHGSALSGKHREEVIGVLNTARV